MEHIPTSENFILGDLSYPYKWGYCDTQFKLNNQRNVEVTGHRYEISGYEMPYLIPFVEEVLHLPFHTEERPTVEPFVPKSKKK